MSEAAWSIYSRNLTNFGRWLLTVPVNRIVLLTFTGAGSKLSLVFVTPAGRRVSGTASGS